MVKGHYYVPLQCKVGDRLSIRVGGDFVYPPTCYSELSDLLLIAGGVGINPLFSMLQHHTHLLHLSGQRSNASVLSPKGRVQLLYSARSKDELIFKVRVRVQHSLTVHSISGLYLQCDCSGHCSEIRLI